MPTPEQLAAFEAKATDWTAEDIARTESHNALAAMAWVNDEGPKDSAEFEARVANIIAAAEAIGYQAQRQHHPAPQTGSIAGFASDILYVSNGPGNVIYNGHLRFGGDYSGLATAEGWIRGEVSTRSRAVAKKTSLAKQSARISEELGK